MSQPIWHPPRIEHDTSKPTRRYRAFSPKEKIMIWLAALASSWLMGLGVVKLSLMLYTVLRQFM